LRKNPALPLLLGGAAVYRCGNCLVLNSALAAEGTTLDRLLFPQPVQPCRNYSKINRGFSRWGNVSFNLTHHRVKK
jgi:hypothetical protein